MQSSNPTEYQKFSFTPPAHGEPVSGIPVGSTNQSQFYAPPAPIQSTQETPWSTGLYDCFDDVPNCILTCLCPCITLGQIAEIVDKGSTSCGTSGGLYAILSVVAGCACCYSYLYRAKMRKQYMLEESPCGDCLVHFCCDACALCQEYRELKNRGFDMSIGWNENMEKQNRGVTMAPAVQGGMSR